MERQKWLMQVLASIEQRYDTYAPTFDENGWNVISPTHHRMMEHFLELMPPNSLILDAACGTGKYWQTLLQKNHRIIGIDNSQAMLDEGKKIDPTVQTEKKTLQDIDYESTFEGIICVDALEFVFPEDWPGVMSNFYKALKSSGYLYFTVEIPEDDLVENYQTNKAAGMPVIMGESYEDGGYHYHPSLDQIKDWFSPYFSLLRKDEGDYYYHYIVQKSME